jgi:hypothetical protein
MRYYNFITLQHGRSNWSKLLTKEVTRESRAKQSTVSETASYVAAAILYGGRVRQIGLSKIDNVWLISKTV